MKKVEDDKVYTIDRTRWACMSIFEQMGNIYSEVGRTFNAKHCNDAVAYEHALTRAIDLFDATVESLVAKHSPKTKEVLRAKEEFLRVCSQDANAKEILTLDRYFLQFAIAARLTR